MSMTFENQVASDYSISKYIYVQELDTTALLICIKIYQVLLINYCQLYSQLYNYYDMTV